jgi:hypothetical protein
MVMWDFVTDESGGGAGFLRELRFPCQTTFHLVLHNHLYYCRDWHNRPGLAAVPIASQNQKKKKSSYARLYSLGAAPSPQKTPLPLLLHIDSLLQDVFTDTVA